MNDWVSLEKQYYMQVARRQPIVLVRGDGVEVWDEKQKRYLDFTSGWAVNNVGHCNPYVVKAIANQAATLIQTSNQFYTLPQIQLSQLLIDNSCLDRAFICNSGAEANEGAVKIARKYGRQNRDGAYEVITAFDSFHGRTLTMVAATGQPHYQETWTPLMPGFTHVPFNDIDAIRAATTDKTCAVMLEPVQGEGGVNVPDPDYLKQVRSWCDDQGLLLILDEVQTGMGRLGSLFGYQLSGIEPDVITLAKGLGGGMPIGAFLAKEHAAILEPGDHGSTFGGNPVTCAAAQASLQYLLDHEIPRHADQVGARLAVGLKALAAEFPGIAEVRGLGLLLAVQFHGTIANDIVSMCNDMGLLLNPVRPTTIRLMPPLTITNKEVDEALGILTRVFSHVLSSQYGT